jgi:hypothetical protein
MTIRAALLLLPIAIAGCGSSAGDNVAVKTPTAASTPAATATATETPTPEATAEATTESSGGSSEVTPLGTTLKVGEAAVIDYTDSSNNKKSLVKLTPKDIEEGSKDDFKNIELDADQKTATPYYAHFKVENVGKKDLSGAEPAGYINGVDDRGQDQNEVIFFGDFEACNHETPKSLKAGQSYETCLVYLIPKGGSLEGFHWIQFDEKSGKSDLNWK